LIYQGIRAIFWQIKCRGIRIKGLKILASINF